MFFSSCEGSVSDPLVGSHIAIGPQLRGNLDITRLGGAGRFPGKCHGQILSLFRNETLDHMVSPLQGCSVSHIVYPHEMFAMLHARYRTAFEVHMGASTAALRSFWERFITTPYGHTHPWVKDRSLEELAWCLPIVLHGDAVPYAHKSSAMFIQWGSLTGNTTALAEHLKNVCASVEFGFDPRLSLVLVCKPSPLPEAQA